MKAGAENRKKTIAAGVLGTLALICIGYAYNTIFGGPSTSVPTPAPTVQPATASTTTRATGTASSTSLSRTSSSTNNGNGQSAIPGVEAQRVATASSSLDPTLDETAMLRTENLVYSGAGRNIFSATYTPPVLSAPPIPKQQFSPRPQTAYTPPPVQTGPPPPPPINLKFFGTATRANGQRQAFLLQGENVYLASTGDIVARKYKVVSITSMSVQVTDLQNNNTQNLPFQAQ